MLGLGLIDGEIFLITSCSCSSYCWCSGTVLSLLFCLSLLARKADLYFCLPEPLPRRNNSNPVFFTMEESVWLLISICPSCIFPLLVDHFPHWLGLSSLSDFFTYLISFFYSHFSFLCRQPLHVFFPQHSVEQKECFMGDPLKCLFGWMQGQCWCLSLTCIYCRKATWPFLNWSHLNFSVEKKIDPHIQHHHNNLLLQRNNNNLKSFGYPFISSHISHLVGWCVYVGTPLFARLAFSAF